MYVTDIEDDLRTENMRGCEDAFRALVGYPNEAAIVDASSAEQLDDLLGRLCEALQYDESTLPSAIRSFVETDFLHGDLNDWIATYSGAATVVREHRDIFLRAFQTHLGGDYNG